MAVRILTKTAGLIFGMCLAQPAHPAEPSPVPAPYKPLPAGTALDYGSWKCMVQAHRNDIHTCRGPNGEEAQFYRKLVPVGLIPASGYGSSMRTLNCEYAFRGSFRHGDNDISSILLSQSDRKALDSLWPLRVGTSVSFRRNFRPLAGRAKSTIRVSGTRTISFQNTEYPVYVLNGRTTKVFCAEDESETKFMGFDEVWWYAPGLDAVVHYELNGIVDNSFSGGTARLGVSYDLKSITPPATLSPVAELPAAGTTEAARVAVPGPALPPVSVEPDKTPPEIEVPENLQTRSSVVRLAGRVRDRSRVIEVTIDGQPIAVARDGSFSVSRGVARGKSTLSLAAIDEWGNSAVRRVAIDRTPTVAAVPPRGAPASKPHDPFAGLHFGRYHALIIGNNRYRSLPDLRTAEADAQAVSDLLRRAYGFQVTLRLNATRADVIDELARMRASLTANDNLLVYYAGHGVVDRVTEQGYWLPVDAEEDSPANWISTYDITNMLRAIRAKHAMVVADSCYSGTLVRAVAARIKLGGERRAWIERILKKRARTALVSGGLEPVRDGGGGRHSVFAKAFLDALSENRSVLEGEALFDAIKRPVALNANQTPQYSDIRFSGHDGGDFVFVRR